ncbi:hypothetical protein QLS71_003470 [Mariniflexile litorale]|uniref:Uncharacterized protein n=1 Tax=Mariniflexile litorale TaxID=3045158 RepID=A0AAU7EIE1_9FLAO|nr:hypothetical protein [Mariniflexile sp. KMM 9835]MDQ8210078.1 hypothetical protein [Mariniflexile sp. KMM 9835]
MLLFTALGYFIFTNGMTLMLPNIIPFKKEMVYFTAFIENFIMKGKPENRKIAKKLRKLGLKYKSVFPKPNFSIKDRYLVTSQNPYSSDAFNALFMSVLLEYNQV